MSQTQALKPTLVHHIHLQASPEKVYEHLTQAHLLELWFPKKVSAEPRIGGSLCFEFLHDDGSRHSVDGRFLELIPGQRVVYSWNQDMEEGRQQSNFTVIFRLEAKDGGTDLFLEESGYRDDAAHLKFQGQRTQGWTFFFSNLKSLLEEGKDNRSR